MEQARRLSSPRVGMFARSIAMPFVVTRALLLIAGFLARTQSPRTHDENDGKSVPMAESVQSISRVRQRLSLPIDTGPPTAFPGGMADGTWILVSTATTTSRTTGYTPIPPFFR